MVRNVTTIRIKDATYQRLCLTRKEFGSWDDMINAFANVYEHYSGKLPRPTREEMLNKIREEQTRQKKDVIR